MKFSAKIRKTFEGETNLRAFADVTVDGGLVLKGFKVMQNKEGELFVAPPSEKSEKDDKYYDTIIPLSGEVRQQIEGAVFRAYSNIRNQEMAQGHEFDPTDPAYGDMPPTPYAQDFLPENGGDGAEFEG